MDDKIKELKKIIDESSNIVFFGGAGVSTESGIPDFRSANGIYNQDLGRTVSPEEMISHTFYKRHTEDFFEFYKDKLIYENAEPNNCHKALAELERQGKVKAIVTQNIDGLHQKAGSKVVWELHGSTLRNYCEKCHTYYGLDKVLESKGLDSDVIDGAVRAISNADTLIVGGTTLIVYPAAGLIHYFHGKKLVLINMSSTSADSSADLVIHERIGKVFAQVMGWQ